MKSQFVRVPSTRAIFSTENLIAIVPNGLNEYGLVIRYNPVVLKADGNDVDFIVSVLGESLIEQSNLSL